MSYTSNKFYYFLLGSLNCAAFVAGIIEAFLNGTGFVSAVRWDICFLLVFSCFVCLSSLVKLGPSPSRTRAVQLHLRSNLRTQ